MAALAASPNLAGLNGLWLSGCRIGAGAKALAGARLSWLTTLDLSYNHLEHDDAAALAGSPHMTGLVWLLLDANLLGDDGVRALVSWQHLRGLRVLELSSNRLSPEGRGCSRAART